MKICPECKEDVPIDAVFCIYCRYKFVVSYTDATKRLSIPKNVSMLFSGAAPEQVSPTITPTGARAWNDTLYLTRSEVLELLKEDHTLVYVDLLNEMHISYRGKPIIIVD